MSDNQEHQLKKLYSKMLSGIKECNLLTDSTYMHNIHELPIFKALTKMHKTRILSWGFRSHVSPLQDPTVIISGYQATIVWKYMIM